jgi:hypothetical protein
MHDSSKYVLHLDPKYDFLQLIDVPALVEPSSVLPMGDD